MIFFIVSSFETLFSALINLKNAIIIILGKLRCAFYEEYYIYDMSRTWIDFAPALSIFCTETSRSVIPLIFNIALSTPIRDERPPARINPRIPSPT